jgi:hypothetical protein
MASHQEYVPYLANKFFPAPVLVLLARSARLEPVCEEKCCLYYTWKDICASLFFVTWTGVMRTDAVVCDQTFIAYHSISLQQFLHWSVLGPAKQWYELLWTVFGLQLRM